MGQWNVGKRCKKAGGEIEVDVVMLHEYDIYSSVFLYKVKIIYTEDDVKDECL